MAFRWLISFLHTPHFVNPFGLGVLLVPFDLEECGATEVWCEVGGLRVRGGTGLK